MARESFKLDPETGELVVLTLPLTPPPLDIAEEVRKKEQEELKLTHPGNYL